MRPTLAATLLCLMPAMLSQPAAAQVKRGPVYLTLMGEPFQGHEAHSPVAVWMGVADTNRNGSISLAELTADSDRFFKLLDVDGDGRIGGEEMTRYEKEIAPAVVRARAGMRGVEIKVATIDPRENKQDDRADLSSADRQRIALHRQRSLPSDTAPTSAANIPQPVAMTDTDMSGSVTVEEFTRAAARRFAVADLNKNGLLEPGELTRGR